MSMKVKTSKRAQSIVGLTLIDGQLRACHATRAKGGLEVVKTASAALTRRKPSGLSSSSLMQPPSRAW